jgi:diguanylate cyclase (GGDEF)-like protein
MPERKEPERRRAENAAFRKRVENMTDEEKSRALVTDELTGIGNRRAWEEGDRRPFQATLDVEGLKWVNDNLGWAAGDALLRAVAAAILEEGVRGYRLGGDEFVFEGDDRAAVRAAVGRIRARLGRAQVEATLEDGSVRRLKGARVHAGIGHSLGEADAALNRAKKAGVASGERAERGRRPRGLTETAGGSPRSEARASGLRFYLRALQEADPDFGASADGDGDGDDEQMSREWRMRTLR